MIDLIKYGFDIFMHLDTHLGAIIREYGLWTYLLLFLIIFCETGLVVTPFLPGDSLLFAAGTFAGLGSLSPVWLAAALCLAAVGGDNLNYFIGRTVGPKVFSSRSSRWFNKDYLDRTHRFYEKYGGKTVIIARFIPIIRTFTPFVAGIGSMTYARFIAYDVAGGIAWILIFTLGGFFFGNIPLVRSNFSIVVVAIIIISVMPAVVEAARQRLSKGEKRLAKENTPA
jgi:membrane-associated protein